MCGAGCDEMTQLAVQKALRPLVQMAASDSTRQAADACGGAGAITA